MADDDETVKAGDEAPGSHASDSKHKSKRKGNSDKEVDADALMPLQDGVVFNKDDE